MTPRPLLAAVAALTLAGCTLGPRPTVTDERKPDDAAVAEVLDRLALANAATFTASYTITPAAADRAPVTAVVRHDGSAPGGRTRVTIGAVEYVDDGGEQRTCAAGLVDCVAGYDETRISDLSLTSSFWSTSASRRLGADAARDVADAVVTDEAIAGQAATCAAIALADANATCSALQTGPLARYAGNDVAIELTAYSPATDPAEFG